MTTKQTIVKNKRKPPLKFIDRLENELNVAGIRIKRGGMTDYSHDESGKLSKRMDDNCEWVTIIMKNKDGSKKYEVEFYFSKNSTKLESVHVYVKKKKKGYGGGKLIALDNVSLSDIIKRTETPQEKPPSTNNITMFA